MTTSSKLAGVAALALLAGACSKGADRPASTPPPAGLPAAEAERINEQLLRGQVKEARRAIVAALKRDPGNPAIQLLRDSLDGDPKELLGPQSYAYTVRAGDTLSGLAQTLLGNRLKAYQLGRYNGLMAPTLLVPGQVLRIPGQLPRSEPVRRTEPAPTPRAPAPSTPSVARPTPTRPAPPAATAPAGANPAAGRQFRAAGLAALNQGNVVRAVGLLRRAAAADPGNPLIARDLARAERIAATVRARR